MLDEAPVLNPPDIDRAHGKGVTRRRITERKPASSKPVQCTGDDQAWTAICALHADSELVAFREDDGTVSIETTGGRVAAQPVARPASSGRVIARFRQRCLSCQAL